jgi:Leucine-rich repeat (LRR) protein
MTNLSTNSHMFCNSSNLTSISCDAPIDLKILHCFNNKLTNIPESLINLQELSCWHNKLTNIPESLINLQELYCWHNKLTNIPESLINLQKLYCGDNENLKIPILRKLNVLICEGCRKFKKAGISSILEYRIMLENYDKIMPFLIGIKKKKLKLNNDIIYKLKKL